MTDLHELNEKLEFVRGAVSRGRVNVGSPALYFLWAAITGVGFALPAIAPDLAWRFWLFAVPAGGIASVWLGRRHARATGRVDPDLARRQGMHWLACGTAMATLMAGFLTDRLQWDVALPLLMGVTGLSYLLAGIHFHPPLRWAGAMFLASGFALWWVPAAQLSVFTGVAVAISLCVAGFIARRHILKD